MMKHFYNEPHMGEDWFTFPALYKNMVEKFPTGSRFVEIGSWKGKSAAFMAVEIINSDKDIKFDCIDIWADVNETHVKHTGDELYQIFLNNIEPVKHIINPIRKDSVSVAEEFENESVDFVFIDGDHSYEGVKKDILAWLPKMKPNNSVLAGHDYSWTPHIQKLLNEMFGVNDYSDPWNAGCFMFKVVDGKLEKFSNQVKINIPKPTTFHYKVEQ